MTDRRGFTRRAALGLIGTGGLLSVAHTLGGTNVSAGRAPIDADDRVVEMESLEDLVDVAIDASERVVYDAGAGRYVVIDGDGVYRYDDATTDDADGAGGKPDPESDQSPIPDESAEDGED